MATLTYDFESDTLGAAPAGWAYETGDATTWTVADDGGDKVFKSPVNKGQSWWSCLGSGTMTNTIVTGKFKTLGDVSKSKAGVVLRQNGTSGRNGYLVDFPGANGIAIYEYVNDAFAGTKATYVTTYTADTWYNFKVETTGTTIRAKTWAIGAGEPGWLASGTDATHASGKVCTISGPLNIPDNAGVEFNDITIDSAAFNIGVSATPLGTLEVTGYDPSVSFTNLTDVSPHGRLEVTGYDPLVIASLTPSVGALAIAGYNPAVSAQQPQTATLWFKFRADDGVVKSFNIGRRPSLQTVVAPAGDPPESFTDVNDDIVLVDATNNSIMINLPQASTRTGFIFWIKKIDSSANVVAVTPDGADTIDGDATLVLYSEHEVVSLVSDGSDWWVI